MLRNANESDAAKIRILMQSVPGFWQPQWSEQTISDAIESANGLACVWEQDSEILGFVCAHDLGLSRIGFHAAGSRAMACFSRGG